MANIEQFVAKTGFAGQDKPKKSNPMQKFHIDQVILKHMSKDGLVAMMQKQQRKIISRSALNEELLQNIKKAQLATKKIQERISSLPDLRLAKSRSSTLSVAASSPVFRSQPLDSGKSVPHGFQYRSDGNFRFLRQNSIEDKDEVYEKMSQRDLTFLKQTLLKATMVHSRDANGDYMLTPMLNEVLKRETRASKISPQLSDSLEAFRFITKDNRQQLKVDSNAALAKTILRDKPLIGRRFFIRENNKFINDMMQLIYLLEHHPNSHRQFTERCVNQDGREDDSISLREEMVYSSSVPTFATQRPLSTEHSPICGTMLQGKSSASMRCGVSSPTVEPRKSLLQEYMNNEVKRVTRMDSEIEEYIRDIQKVMAEREKKRAGKEAKSKMPFDLWKTVFQENAPETNQQEIDLNPVQE